ncbi:hypothetical protein SAMN02927916_1514 [Flavobacterium anhuiense]|uniref:Toxin-antitoxin system, antitoxin component, ribbon-helix-helix domain protein n=2 Tax=Flavobacterium anhuiense TaxID=459526 RepID=A0ABY0LIT2_9FLAO|nr:hypothetical protein SAMN02927916_1514 [Flavobacterium anhuiense]
MLFFVNLLLNNKEKMTQITLNIPDEELAFFMKLIEKFNYETVIDDFSVSKEIRDLLDQRRATSKAENFVPWNEAKKQFVFKSDK